MFYFRARFFNCRIGYFHVRSLVSEGRRAGTRADYSGLIGECVRRTYRLVNDRGFYCFRRSTIFRFLIFRFLRATKGRFAFLFAVFKDLVFSFYDRADWDLFCLLDCVFLTRFLFCGQFLRAVLVVVITITILSTAALPHELLAVKDEVYGVKDGIVGICFLLVGASALLLYVYVNVLLQDEFDCLVIVLASFLSGDVLSLFPLVLAGFFLFFPFFPFFLFQFLFKSN